MKKFLTAIIAVAMVLSAIAAMAYEEKAYTITPKLAYSYQMNKDTRDLVDYTFGILVEGSMSNFPVGLEVGYLWGSKKTNGIKHNLDQFPILATYKAAFTPDSPFYYDLGLGFSINKLKESGDSTRSCTSVAFKAMAGWEFAENFVAEAGYVNYGSVDSNALHSLQINVGYSF